MVRVNTQVSIKRNNLQIPASLLILGGHGTPALSSLSIIQRHGY